MRRARGFTLTELAIALAIIAFLLGGVVVTLQSQIEARNQAETRRTLDLAVESLIGFAIHRGRLPCPATLGSLGREDIVMTGMPGGISFDDWGNCAVADGFLPAADLGITPTDSQGFAIDAWGSNVGGLNRIRYAVSRAQVTVNGNVVWAFTGKDAVRRTGFTVQPEIWICGVAPAALGATNCDAGVVAMRAPAVVYSLGPNGGIAAAQTQAAFEASAASADERENYNTNPRIFVARPATPAGANEFDDIVSFLSLNVLYNRLVAANPL
jgi:prepilin-type N-terminal cleavage/methylation domain-containing protein